MTEEEFLKDVSEYWKEYWRNLISQYGIERVYAAHIAGSRASAAPDYKEIQSHHYDKAFWKSLNAG